jgi:hypothetical protein
LHQLASMSFARRACVIHVPFVWMNMIATILANKFINTLTRYSISAPSSYIPQQFFKHKIKSPPKSQPPAPQRLSSPSPSEISHATTLIFPGAYMSAGVTAIASLIFRVNTSNDRINCGDVIFQAQVAGMHCDYQEWPQNSYPVDPVILSR